MSIPTHPTRLAQFWHREQVACLTIAVFLYLKAFTLPAAMGIMAMSCTVLWHCLEDSLLEKAEVLQGVG